MEFTVQPIAHIRTPYKEKFAIPRQPGLVDAAHGFIQFTNEFSDPNYIRGIEQFSHLWLIFQFHQTTHKGSTPLVRPPRLGGNKKIGVFASRSTFRPNNLGMSVVNYVGLEERQGKLGILVSGMDLLDNTPIIDIKPYLPYADAIQDAQAGYAQSPPSTANVTFDENVLKLLAKEQTQYPKLIELISQILSQDPRPAYKQNDTSDRLFGMQLYDFNIRWRVIEGTNHVVSCENCKKDSDKG